MREYIVLGLAVAIIAVGLVLNLLWFSGGEKK